MHCLLYSVPRPFRRYLHPEPVRWNPLLLTLTFLDQMHRFTHHSVEKAVRQRIVDHTNQVRPKDVLLCQGTSNYEEEERDQNGTKLHLLRRIFAERRATLAAACNPGRSPQ